MAIYYQTTITYYKHDYGKITVFNWEIHYPVGGSDSKIDVFIFPIDSLINEEPFGATWTFPTFPNHPILI